MKRVLFFLTAFLLLGIGTNCFAQYADAGRVDGNIKYTFGAYKNAQGDRIKKSELKNYFDAYQYADYQRGSRKITSGIILTSIGTLLGGCGVLQYECAIHDRPSPIYIPIGEPIIIAGGAICAAIGIPMLIIGNSQLNRIAKEYNNGQTVSMSLGYQKYGLGLALNF